MNYRNTPNKICEIIEMIYANETYTLEERVTYAKKRKSNPYPTTYDDINGVRWLGRMFCGHNPYLEARLVDNLHVITDEKGNQELEWKEREKPNIDINK